MSGIQQLDICGYLRNRLAAVIPDHASVCVLRSSIERRMVMNSFDFNELVEANLTALAFNQDSKTIVLHFRTADESRHICITASQVVDFLGEDFCTSNIVDFVRVFSGEGPSDEELRMALTYVFRGSSSDVVPPQLELHASMVRKKELVLLDFVPVCGALIMVLAGDVHVEVTAIEHS